MRNSGSVIYKMRNRNTWEFHQSWTPFKFAALPARINKRKTCPLDKKTSVPPVDHRFPRVIYGHRRSATTPTQPRHRPPSHPGTEPQRRTAVRLPHPTHRPRAHGDVARPRTPDPAQPWLDLLPLPGARLFLSRQLVLPGPNRDRCPPHDASRRWSLQAGKGQGPG